MEAIVEITNLNEERQRAELSCKCVVDGTAVLEGEAVVKIPRRPQELSA